MFLFEVKVKLNRCRRSTPKGGLNFSRVKRFSI